MNSKPRHVRPYGAFFLALVFVVLGAPGVVHAAELAVAPLVIDGEGKQRDILKYTIKLENTGTGLLSVYPWVTDLLPSGTAGGDLAGAKDKELRESLARWIEVSRSAIDLLPGDTREIPVLIQINLNAAPGTYHAVINFSPGSDRKNAEANTDGTARVMVNIEVEDDANERLQLGTFVPEESFFSGDAASFAYRIENIGNRGIVPGGSVRIYDRRGAEIATLPANEEGTKIEPSTKAQLASVWGTAGHFGRYKAVLDIEYGDNRTIQDTVFFWVLPWQKLLAYFFTLAVMMVIIALLIHTRMESVRHSPSPLPETPGESAPSFFSRVRGMRSTMEEREDDEGDPGLHAFLPARMIETPARHIVLPPRRESQSGKPDAETRLPRREHPSHRQGTHSVTLSKPARAEVDPGHVVDLKRR